MAAKAVRFLCLVLGCAILAGLFVGNQGILIGLPSATTPNIEDLPSSSSTIPVTTAPSTIPKPTTPRPTLPEPVPLPPSTGHTLQVPSLQKPAKPNVAIPKLSASDYFIYDTRIGEFLYISCDASKTLYPASITKLFTTYVALQYLSAQDMVTVGKELSYVAWDASDVGFRKGDSISVETLVYSALLPSGCDASYILAAAAGRIILNDSNASAKDSISAFMNECNRLAQELGMENTYLVTPDGYHHKDHKISMQAFVIIGKCSLENELIAKAVTSTEATVSYTNSKGKTCTLVFQNTNMAILTDNKYYNAHCVGLKTGFTDKAGYCLLTAYKVDDRYILVGIFGCKKSDNRFADANKLFNAYLPYL